jgi:hypothetical protein
MPKVGFKSTTPVSKRTKTVNALDRVATVIGNYSIVLLIAYNLFIYL